MGTLLSLVNQGDVLLHGRVSAASAVQIAANFAIPYVVSSIGYLNAYRRVVDRRGPGDC